MCTLRESKLKTNILDLLAIFLTILVGQYAAEDYEHNTPAPDFLPTPSNITFQRGELAVLRCSVYNLGTKTVVWRRLDSSFPLTSGTMTVVADDRLQIGHVAYKNQWDLMIKNVQPEDDGVYECQVSSRDKTVRRLVALTVIDPESEVPEIQITMPQYVERGERIMLQCNATGEYYPPDEMDWFRNGERLTSSRNKGMTISKQYSIAKRKFTSALKIERASMKDDGTYVCRSSNMQITSTKVHVLNAETFNRKRDNELYHTTQPAIVSSDANQLLGSQLQNGNMAGTLHEDDDDDKMAKIVSDRNSGMPSFKPSFNNGYLCLVLSVLLIYFLPFLTGK